MLYYPIPIGTYTIIVSRRALAIPRISSVPSSGFGPGASGFSGPKRTLTSCYYYHHCYHYCYYYYYYCYYYDYYY